MAAARGDRAPGDAPSEVPSSAPPPAPRIWSAVRAALGDFYYNSWRLVPANLAWGALLLALLAAAGLWSALALLGLPLLAVPQAGMARLAALIARGESVSLGDAVDAWRRYLAPSLLLGYGLAIPAVVLGVNVVYGIADGGIVAVAIGTLALWGLVALAAFGVAAWPLLVDPVREDVPVRDRLRLAAMLGLAHPGRLLGLAGVVALVLALSTAAFAALLSVSVAYAALIAARYVLPAADRLEARLGERRRASGTG